MTDKDYSVDRLKTLKRQKILDTLREVWSVEDTSTAHRGGFQGLRDGNNRASRAATSESKSPNPPLLCTDTAHLMIIPFLFFEYILLPL